jgi:polysaccharide export outer membrane protein
MTLLTRALALLAVALLAEPCAAERLAFELGAVSPPAAFQPSEAYRIGAGDTLRITVYQSPDLSLETRVTESGVISFPLVGRVEMGGLSIADAEAALAASLKKGDFVKNPQVMIVVTTVRANQVSVLGQVGRPGRIPLDVTGMRLTEVLALAGGVVAGVGADSVVLVGQRSGKPFRREIDLARVFTEEGRADDLVVMPGDSIWVDRAPQVYLYGEVQRPGQFRLERGMTVMQALAVAGGLTQRGTLRGLEVRRASASGRGQTVEPAMDDLLRAGDVMFVHESLF